MPSRVSVCLDPTAFAVLVDALARQGRADLFLSGPGCVGAARSVVGFAPHSELVVTTDTPPDALSGFCFGSADPALGFLGYGYGLALRRVATQKQTGFPAGLLRKYGAYLEYDARQCRAEIYGPDAGAVHALARLAQNPPVPMPFVAPAPAPVAQSLSRVAYEQGVVQTLEHIRAGQTYQLNLSIRFQRPARDLDVPGLFRSLWRTRPAPYYAFMRQGSYEIVSTSPERFLRVRGGQVLSQPIKGTLAFAHYQPGLERRLLASGKESAELSMIVDLVRNDISANCEYGSVHVGRHKAVFVVDRLVQMYSEVHGQLRADKTCLDLLLDAFPPGSVSGCPKRSSLELIDALEPHARDLYCGCFVIVRGPRDLDSSVAIRTGWRDAQSGLFSFFAGSGIVVDSKPALEYAETMAKAEKFLTLGAA